MFSKLQWEHFHCVMSHPLKAYLVGDISSARPLGVELVCRADVPAVYDVPVASLASTFNPVPTFSLGRRYWLGITVLILLSTS